jgi:hypothetical protein
MKTLIEKVFIDSEFETRQFVAQVLRAYVALQIFPWSRVFCLHREVFLLVLPSFC